METGGGMRGRDREMIGCMENLHFGTFVQQVLRSQGGVNGLDCVSGSASIFAHRLFSILLLDSASISEPSTA